MKCQDYIFKLTSQQLEDAPLAVQTSARVHRMLCKRCRAFTRNDETLDKILGAYREHLQAPSAKDQGH